MGLSIKYKLNTWVESSSYGNTIDYSGSIISHCLSTLSNTKDKKLILKSSCSNKQAMLMSSNYYETIRPVLTSDQLSSTSLLDIKRFLKSKNIDSKQTHACLILSIPKHILCFDPSKSENKPDTRWKKVESELCTLYINKRTGGYVCPE